MQQKLSPQVESLTFWKKVSVGFVIAAAVIFLYGLGTRPFIDYDEAIYANVIQGTAASDNPLVIQGRDGNPFFDKPPLYYWAGVLSQKVFLHDEFSYRLPAAVAGLLCVVLTILIVFTITESWLAGFVAGLILFSTPLFFEASRQVRLDTMATSGILLTYYAFLRGLKQPRWFLLIGVGLAIGVLTKNVIGLLSIPAIALWAFINRDYAWLRNWYLWGGIGIAAALVLPWHIMQTVLFGSRFWTTYMGFSVVERFQGNVNGGANPTNGLYFFYLATFAFPWTWVGAISVGGLILQRKKINATRVLLATGLATASVGGIFLLAGTKLPYYMIPGLAFLAIFLGCTFWELWTQFPKTRNILTSGVVVLALIAFINVIFVGFHYQKMMWMNDVISANEYEIGILIRNNNDELPIYTFNYPYWDTMNFYSGKTVQAMQVDQLLDRPFYLVVGHNFYMSNPFPAELNARLTPLLQGDAAVLLKFEP